MDRGRVEGGGAGYMQKHAPQTKERTKLEIQASIMFGPQLSIDRPPRIPDMLVRWGTEKIS